MNWKDFFFGGFLGLGTQTGEEAGKAVARGFKWVLIGAAAVGGIWLILKARK